VFNSLGFLNPNEAQHQEIKNPRMEKCHQQHQEIKNEDMFEKVVGNFFSGREAQYCDAEIIFVKKLGRNLEDGTLFFWGAKTGVLIQE
jgi:hypothetical protein